MAKLQNVIFLPHMSLTLSVHSHDIEKNHIVPTPSVDDSVLPTRTNRRRQTGEQMRLEAG